MASADSQRMAELLAGLRRALPTVRGLRQALRRQLVARPRRWTRPREDQLPQLPKYAPHLVGQGSLTVTAKTVTVPNTETGLNGIELLAILKDFGPGPAKLSNLRLGEKVLQEKALVAGSKRTLENATGISYELREGRAGDAGFTIYAQVLDTQAFTETLKRKADERSFGKLGPLKVTPKGTTRVDVELSFPKGLSKKVKKANGQIIYKPLTATFHLCHRPVGSGLEVGEEGATPRKFTVTGIEGDSATSARPFTHLEPGLLISENETSDAFKKGSQVVVRWSYLSDEEQKPEILWVKLKCRGPKTPGGLAGHCLLAIEGPSSAFAQDQYLSDLRADVAYERMDWNGASWAVRPTRSPAAAARDILQGLGNLRPLADARLDLPSFQAWAEECTTRKWFFDFAFGADGQRGTVREALAMALAAGNATPSVGKDGKWGVVREPDPATATPAGHFCPRNAHSFRERRSFFELPHAIDATFRNRAKKFLEDTIRIYAEGFNADGSGGKTAASRFEEWAYDGVTEEAQVKDLVARALLVGDLRGAPVEFAEDHGEAIRVTRGDVVRVANDNLGWGLAQGRLKAGTAGSRLILDEPVTMVSPDTYEVRLVRPDGTSVLRSLVFAAGTHAAVDTATAHGAAEGDLFFFGKTGETDKACVVLEVVPGPDFSTRLTVAELAAGIVGASASGTQGSTAAAPTAIAPPNVSGVSGAGGLVVSFGAS